MPVLRPLALALLLLSPLSAPAQEEDDSSERLEFAGDLYVAGAAPRLEGAADDLFAAGETLRSRMELTGDAALAGRRIDVQGPVAGDVYAAGQDVRISAEVGGDATLAGYDVSVSGPVGGDVRAAASNLVVDAPISGALLAAAGRVEINAPVSGDARLEAGEIRFGPEGRIEGTLSATLPEEAGAPPPGAVPPERVERLPPEPWQEREWSVWAQIGAAVSFVLGWALVFLAIQALFVGAAPRWSEEVAFDAQERPFRSLGVGLLTLAALIGAVPVLAVTVIGLPLVPVALLGAVAAVLAGYALGAWTLGVMIWRWLDRAPPAGFGARLGIAALGLLAAALLGLIPFAGWLVFLALMLGGLGAAMMDLAGPRPTPAR